jgi:hypothetical protein
MGPYSYQNAGQWPWYDNYLIVFSFYLFIYLFVSFSIFLGLGEE